MRELFETCVQNSCKFGKGRGRGKEEKNNKKQQRGVPIIVLPLLFVQKIYDRFLTF